MAEKMTVEIAATKVIYALKKAGYSEEKTHEIFSGLYYGKQWDSYELFRAIRREFALTV